MYSVWQRLIAVKSIQLRNLSKHNKYSTLTNTVQIDLHPLIALGLLKKRGITQLTELQRDTYISIASGMDVRINAETG